MWFPLALTAMLMLVVRRGTEKTLAGRIPATAMAWLQQLVALPFVVLALFLPWATFFNPFELSAQFYWILILYVILGAADVILYFKALSLGDISVLASMLSLVVVSNLVGAYFILDQTPSAIGVAGSACILAGAYLASRRLASPDAVDTAAHKKAIVLILIVVVLRGIFGPMEVIPIRETDPFYFNFASSLLTVPVVMAIMYVRGRRTDKPAFTGELMQTVKTHKLGLLLIGVTYTINLTCTYAGKLIADNAAYVTTIKAANVLPMMILGVMLFSERVRKRQWLGLVFILVGLMLFSRA